MKSIPFDPDAELIYVEGFVHGPMGMTAVRFMLDTGATRSLIDMRPLKRVGYGPFRGGSAKIHTGGGVIEAGDVRINRLDCLDSTRTDFQVFASSFERWMGFQGILGLDFLRGNKLTLDFSAGEIEFVELADR